MPLKSLLSECLSSIEQGFFHNAEFLSALEVVYANMYFDAVNAEPSKAMMDQECEEICYLSFHL